MPKDRAKHQRLAPFAERSTMLSQFGFDVSPGAAAALELQQERYDQDCPLGRFGERAQVRQKTAAAMPGLACSLTQRACKMIGRSLHDPFLGFRYCGENRNGCGADHLAVVPSSAIRCRYKIAHGLLSCQALAALRGRGEVRQGPDARVRGAHGVAQALPKQRQ